MEIGVGTIVYEFAGIPLSKSVEHVADHGIRYVDLLAFGDFNPAFLSDEEQRRIADRMKRLNVRASSVITCAHGNLGSDDAGERAFGLEQLKLAGRLIRNLGGRQVLIGKGVGNIDFNLPRERAFETVVQLLKEYCSWCEAHDILVTLELEPEALHLCNGVKSMKAMIDACDAPNLLANVDIGHLNILREGPEALKCIKDKIIHVHISDNDGLAHTNSIIGEGNTDIKWYIDALLDMGIDANASRYGEVAVCGLEIGHPGEYISDPDSRVLKSIGNVYSRIPRLRRPIM